MKGKLFVTTLTFFFSIFISNHLFALSKEIRADQYMVTVKKALDKNDHRKALKYMKKIETLEVKLPNSFYYFKANAQYKSDESKNAKYSLEKYLESEGRQGKYYSEAIELLTEIEEQIEDDEYDALRSKCRSIDKKAGAIWKEYSRSLNTYKQDYNHLCRSDRYGWGIEEFERCFGYGRINTMNKYTSQLSDLDCKEAKDWN